MADARENVHVNALTWLVTPAFVATTIFALVPLYDAPVRWSRRLKSDITIASGLPEGEEKTRLTDTLESQARRLREYREVWTVPRLFRKWAVLSGCGALIICLIIQPPINRPGERPVFSPADWILVLLALYEIAIVAFCIGQGLSIDGRTPRQMMIRDRIKRHDRRWKRLRRLDRERSRQVDEGHRSGTGSRLGFRTQVDPMAGWVRTWEPRSIGRNTGWIAVGISRYAYFSLRDKGVRPPSTEDLHPSWRAPQAREDRSSRGGAS